MAKSTHDQKSRDERKAVRQDRLAIAASVGLVLLLLLMMVDGAIMNPQCSLWQFVTFECNRWDASFKPWE